MTVIGLGGAGNRMLDAVAERIEAADPETPVEYVAVDSNRPDLESHAPEAARTVLLGTDPEEFETHRETRRYIDTDDPTPEFGGAARSRGVGRYFLDNAASLDRFVTELEAAIEEAVHSSPIGEGTHIVWVLHALGGGTGSGAAPLAAALVGDVTAKLGDEVVVCGVGSLPRLDALETSVVRPSGPVSQYVNAYTALRELAVLLDHDDEGVYPLSIDIDADGETTTGDSITIERSPFDIYGLVGTDQDLLDRGDYVGEINRLVADTVHAFSRSEISSRANGPISGLERFGITGHDVNLRGERLFSIDSTAVRAPVDRLRRFVNLVEETDDLRDRIAELEADRHSLERAIRYIDDLLSWWPEADDQPISDAGTSQLEAMAGDCEAFARGHETIDTALDGLTDALNVPDPVATRDVGVYLAAGIIERRLTERLRDHDLHGGLMKVRDAYDVDIDVETADDLEDTLSAWRTADRALGQRLEYLRSEADDTTFNIIRRFELDGLIEETTDDYEALTALAKDYERLLEYRDELRARHSDAELRLERRHADLRDQLTDEQEERKRLESARDVRESELDALSASLAEANVDATGARLPISAPENAPEDMPADAESLPDIVNANLLDETAFSEALAPAVYQLDEPVQDRGLDSRGRPREHLGVLTTAANHEFLDTSLDAMDEDPFDSFEEVSRYGAPEPFAVGLLAVYAPIRLDATSEFGTLDDCYTDPERDLTEQFGTTVTDADVTGRFAYPELVDLDIEGHGSD